MKSFRPWPWLLASFTLLIVAIGAGASPIRVVVWDEREPAQKIAYGGFLGDALANYLEQQPGLAVKSVGLDDPEQGLSDDILDKCDVLIWWGHERHGDVTDAHVQAVLRRLLAGKLSLIALHSAHWSKPFIAAMDERAVADALQTLPEAERATVKVVRLPARGGLAPRGENATLGVRHFKGDDGTDTLEVQMPRCVFPVVRNEGKPSHIITRLPDHPIARGIPAEFEIPQTEIYAGPFYVPTPDAMIFQEKWDDGSTFTSGCAWTVGKGKVFYFRPGHETYPIYKEEFPRKVVLNAIHWAAPGVSE